MYSTQIPTFLMGTGAAEARLIVLIQLFGERGLVAVLIGES